MGNDDDGGLRNLRILVVEDEPLVSMELVDALEEADSFVVGPARSVQEAIDLAHTRNLDAAVLDIELRGEPIYPAADLLIARGVPFIFTTGHDLDVIPTRFGDIPFVSKPTPADEVLLALANRIVRPRPAPRQVSGREQDAPGYMA